MLAVIADTHMPKGARRLPERCVELLSQAEAVIHVGDFFAASVLAEIEALCLPSMPSTATSTSRGCASGCRSGARSSSAAIESG